MLSLGSSERVPYWNGTHHLTMYLLWNGSRYFRAKGTFAPRRESSPVPGLGLGLGLWLCSLARKFTGKKVPLARKFRKPYGTKPNTNPKTNTNPIQLFYAFFEHRPMIFKLASFVKSFHRFNMVLLPEVHTVKDLGVTFDEQLKFSDHHYDKIKKAY